MRAASYYYLTQAWPARERGQIQRGALSRTVSRGRHARPPRRVQLGRDLATVARRVLALLSRTSQPA